MENSLLRKIVHYSYFTIFLLITLVFFTFGPKIEARLFPPVTFFQFFEPIKTPYGQQVSGYLDKPRGSSCVIQDLILKSYSLDNSIPPKIVPVDTRPDLFHTSDDQEEFRTRGEGVQDFGPWLITKREPPVGPVMNLTAIHKCHALWTIETVVWTGTTEELFPGLYDPFTGELK